MDFLKLWQSLGCRPKLRQRQTVQIGGKRNHFGAGVKHHSADPAFAQRMGHRLQSPNVAATQGGTGFDSDSFLFFLDSPISPMG